jgi:hypothetical protein
MKIVHQMPESIIFVTTFKRLKHQCEELQFNRWYVQSLVPTQDEKILVVAKKLLPGMDQQRYTDLDIKGLLIEVSRRTENPEHSSKLAQIISRRKALESKLKN